MLENDQQKGSMLVLDAIRYLGDRGLLDERKGLDGRRCGAILACVQVPETPHPSRTPARGTTRDVTEYDKL